MARRTSSKRGGSRRSGSRGILGGLRHGFRRAAGTDTASGRKEGVSTFDIALWVLAAAAAGFAIYRFLNR